MDKQNRVLIRESFDCSTNEREKLVYTGKLLERNLLENTYHFAFKVDDQIMRMKMKFDDKSVDIEQIYKDATSKIELKHGSTGKYKLVLNTVYELEFMTDTSLIEHSLEKIVLKYNLIDPKTDEIMQLVQISIIGEN